jgi:hypothetical protein
VNGMSNAPSGTSSDSVTFRVVDAEGRAIAREIVDVLDLAGVALASATTDMTGEAVLELEAASEGLVRVGRPARAWSRFSIDDLRSGSEPLVLEMDRDPETVELFGELIDHSGQPAAGIGLVAMRESNGEVLGNTVSDSNGAFVVRVARSVDGDDTIVLRSSTGETMELPELPEATRGLVGPLTYVVDAATDGSDGRVAPPVRLLASEVDTIAALKKTPHLFGPLRGSARASACTPALQGDVASRVVYMEQSLMLPGRPNGAGEEHSDRGRRGRPPEAAGLAMRVLDGESALEADGDALRYGMLIEFRQEWWELGYCLGSLLYSLPLAPCEQTKIATIDWRRRDYARRESALDERHLQDTTVSRDEVVNEVVRMASTKNITGTTEGGGFAFSSSGFSGGFAKTVENIEEAIMASTSAARTVNDRLQQSSTTLRNSRAVAIAEVTQQEENRVATRVVRNHNHCHSLTIQYHEVLQRYLVKTIPQKIRPLVFVPFRPIADFDSEVVSRYGYLLRRALLDPTLAPTLDALLGLPQAPARTADGQPVATGEAVPDQDVSKVRFRASIRATPPQQVDLNRLRVIVDDQIAPLSPAGTTPSGREDLAGTLPSPVNVAALRRVGVAYQSTADITLEDCTLEVQLPGGQWHELLFVPSLTLGLNQRFVQAVGAGSPSATGPAAADARAQRARLLGHLNANSVYYTSAIIAGGDSGRRYLSLSQIHDASDQSLADIVENRIAGFIGNYAAFPVNGIDDLPTSIRAKFRLDRGDPSLDAAPGDERLVTLPTPGVFAESQLGSCSACEKVDNTRFWRWERSPCPDEAPDIDASILASRARDFSELLDVVRSNLGDMAKVELAEDLVKRLLAGGQTAPSAAGAEPLIQVGDATLQELVKNLQLGAADDVLGLVKGLAEISGENYRKQVDQQTELLKFLFTAAAGA